jgi:ATP-dependent DNA ligase
MDWSPPREPALGPAAFIEPCIPTLAKGARTGPAWVHEIKHDGYRLMVCRRGDRVRLFTRRGYDWTDRYHPIANAAAALACDATIDGEAVVCDHAGVADFERLHSREHDKHAFLWAFDLLELDGEDLRPSPLLERIGALRRLLRRAKSGIYYVEHLDGDGAEAFAHACGLGLEGIVSKDRTRSYRSGRSKTWLKIKNPKAPGVTRFEDRDAPAWPTIAAAHLGAPRAADSEKAAGAICAASCYASAEGVIIPRSRLMVRRD